MTAVLSAVGWVLLWILIVLLGLLAVIVLLLCIPVHIMASYGDGMRLRIRYGVIPIQILPLKRMRPEKSKEKPKKEKKKKATTPAKEKPKKALKETLAAYGIPHNLPDTMSELLKMLLQVGKMGNGLRRSLTICYLRVEMICGGADAAQAAINYGRAWPVLVSIERALGAVFRLRRYEAAPVLDYASDRQTLRGEVDLRIAPIRAAAVMTHRGVRILAGYLRIRRKNGGKKSKQIKNQSKGVTTHEQSGS